jgi:hypothetical protein
MAADLRRIARVPAKPAWPPHSLHQSQQRLRLVQLASQFAEQLTNFIGGEPARSRPLPIEAALSNHVVISG